MRAIIINWRGVILPKMAPIEIRTAPAAKSPPIKEVTSRLILTQ